MAIPGQRFQLNLDDTSTPSQAVSQSTPGLDFVKDIQERRPSAAPAPPQLRSTTGFPEHRKRVPRSKTKDRHGPAPAIPAASKGDPPRAAPSPAGPKSVSRADAPGADRASVDRENKQRLARMAHEEIEREQQALREGLSPSLVERLLRRGNIDDGRTDGDDAFEPLGPAEPPAPDTTHDRAEAPPKPRKAVSFDAPVDAGDAARPVPKGPAPPDWDPDAAPAQPPDDLVPATSKAPLPPLSRRPRDVPGDCPPPTLDPSSETFLDDLHAAYFPTLPADPSALAWMRDSASAPGSYDPAAASLAPAELRFDFAGRLLPPSRAQQIPPAHGLHHHGAAPDAAGYTVGELARYARSAVPAQRAVAHQNLGRLLYRLGVGEFGVAGAGGGGEEADALRAGLEGEIRREKVLEGLMAEAGRPEGSGHESARVRAVEALWLWRRGGGNLVDAS